MGVGSPDWLRIHCCAGFPARGVWAHNQLPVMTGNQVVGMLSREDVITFLRMLQELGT